MKNSAVKSPSVGQSYKQTLTQIANQIEFENFRCSDLHTLSEYDTAVSVVYIIAQIYQTPSHYMIRINRARLPAEQVAEVYRSLTYDHVARVVKKFTEHTEPVQNVTAFLRTALFNAVCEDGANRAQYGERWFE